MSRESRSTERTSEPSGAATPLSRDTPSIGDRLDVDKATWTAPGAVLRRCLILLTQILCISFVLVVPLGEAPDEGAHLYYVEHAGAGFGLPRFAPVEAQLSYEAHQPPLDYLLVATLARGLGALPVDFPFVANPNLDFGIPGSRAFLVRETPKDTQLRFRLVRVIRSAWLLPTVIVVFAIARLIAQSEARLSAGAFAAVALAPQVFFVSSTVNNDGGVTFFACVAFLYLARMSSSEVPTRRDAWSAGIAAGLAILSKGNGLALVLPIGIAATWAWRRANRTALSVALLLPTAVGALILLALNVVRFGSLSFEFPLVPDYQPRLAFQRLFEEPKWIATLTTSFWARFGWFNLPLPTASYWVFLPAGVLLLIGLLTAMGKAGEGPREACEVRVARLGAALLAANAAVVIAFMLLVAWQPQGRLLFPSLGAICALITVGASRVLKALSVRGREVFRIALPALTATIGLAANGLSLYWIVRAYE